MFENKSFLAIIPARSGSKGLKDKNIKLLNGKPMIAYTIEAAKKSGVFDDIIVSTDSKRYAEISKKYGADIPFLRPESLSSDIASSLEVLSYTLNRLKNQGKTYDFFMLLQPTSPLRNKVDILEAVKLIIETNSNSVISICKSEHSPRLMNTLDENMSMENFITSDSNKRRQELPKYYRLNGSIYLSKTETFLKTKRFYNKKSKAYIMDRINSLDVDDIVDFKIAECILKEVNNV